MQDYSANASRTGATDVLAFLLIAYILVCIFFNVGFVFGLNPSIGVATLMSNLETAVSLPIFSMTASGMVAFNMWSLEVYLVVAVLLALGFVLYPFRRAVGSSLNKVSQININPALQLSACYLLLLLAYVALLWLAKFPDISTGMSDAIVKALGAILLLGVIWLYVSTTIRERGLYTSTGLAILAMWLFMLIPFQVGLLTGVRHHLRAPSEKAVLATGATMFGRAAAVVPTGVVFVEYQGPGQARLTRVLGNEQIATIGELSTQERTELANKFGPTPVLKTTNLLCEFLESWTRGMAKLCDVVKAQGAVMLSQEGQVIWLSSEDPRAARAVTLEVFQSDLAQQEDKHDKIVR